MHVFKIVFKRSQTAQGCWANFGYYIGPAMGASFVPTSVCPVSEPTLGQRRHVNGSPSFSQHWAYDA